MAERGETFPGRRTGGNEATGLLKLIALVFMFCDHAGKMLLPNESGMRVLGRIAFPVYCWCMVVGACYTRSFPKYFLRVLAVGLISQPLYNLTLRHDWSQLNTFFTLALSVCALWGLREKRFGSQFWGPAAALIAAVLIKPDYGWKGVLLVILLWMARGSRPAIAATFIAYCLFWGSSSSPVSSFFGLSWTLPSALSPLLGAFLRLQGLALLALPLILWNCPVRLRLPKWLGYALYPAHLLVLLGLENLFGVL